MNFIFIIDTSFSMLQYFDRNYTYIDSIKNVVDYFIKSITKYIAPIAIAASFLIIFLLNNNSREITFESIASKEIEEFIDLGHIDYDAESLTIIFPNIELDDNNFISSLSENDVLEYLNENDLEELFYEN